MNKWTTALLAILIMSCNKQTDKHVYNDRRNDCYKGAVKQVIITQYEDADSLNGEWQIPDSTIGTVYKYHYKQDGFMYQLEEFKLYQDSLYLVSTQNISFKDGQPELKLTYDNQNILVERELVKRTGDTGYISEIYDTTGYMLKTRSMILNDKGRQARSKLTFFDPARQAMRIITFDCAYTQDELLDSLNMHVFDGNGVYQPDGDMSLVTNNITMDSVGNPTKTITLGHGAAKGSNMLILREYEYYK